MILREENMMVPTKERSILNAGELIPIVNMSRILAIWLCPLSISQANPVVINWLIFKK